MSRLNASLSILFINLLLTLACNTQNSEEASESNTQAPAEFQQTQIEYARQFRVRYGDNYKLVEVLQAYPGASRRQRYLLLPEGVEAPDTIEADAIVRIPIQEMVSLSTTHIPALDMLKASDVLVGFPSTNYITSANVRQRIAEGKVRELGVSNGLNIEALMELSPDMVMAYGMGPQDKSLRSLERTGIPVVLNADYMEQSPLGRAEWIKFTALFLNKEQQADSIFRQIKSRYDSLQSLTRDVQERPTVFSGIVYNGTWFMPGGNNWSSRFFADAGGDFLWKDTEESGSLQLSFESVLERAQDADYWINVANYESLEALAAADSRYTKFEAFQDKQVYTYTKRNGEGGGNEYLELGYSRPDMVLADLIKILHPELLPDYETYFYERLK